MMMMFELPAFDEESTGIIEIVDVDGGGCDVFDAPLIEDFPVGCYVRLRDAERCAHIMAAHWTPFLGLINRCSVLIKRHRGDYSFVTANVDVPSGSLPVSSSGGISAADVAASSDPSRAPLRLGVTLHRACFKGIADNDMKRYLPPVVNSSPETHTIHSGLGVTGSYTPPSLHNDAMAYDHLANQARAATGPTATTATIVTQPLGASLMHPSRATMTRLQQLKLECSTHQRLGKWGEVVRVLRALESMTFPSPSAALSQPGPSNQSTNSASGSSLQIEGDHALSTTDDRVRHLGCQMLCTLAYAYIAQKDHAAAIDRAQAAERVSLAAISLNERDPLAYVRLGQSYRLQRLFAKAELYGFSKAASLEGGNSNDYLIARDLNAIDAFWSTIAGKQRVRLMVDKVPLSTSFPRQFICTLPSRQQGDASSQDASRCSSVSEKPKSLLGATMPQATSGLKEKSHPHPGAEAELPEASLMVPGSRQQHGQHNDQRWGVSSSSPADPTSVSSSNELFQRTTMSVPTKRRGSTADANGAFGLGTTQGGAGEFLLTPEDSCFTATRDATAGGTIFNDFPAASLILGPSSAYFPSDVDVSSSSCARCFASLIGWGGIQQHFEESLRPLAANVWGRSGHSHYRNTAAAAATHAAGASDNHNIFASFDAAAEGSQTSHIPLPEGLMRVTQASGTASGTTTTLNAVACDRGCAARYCSEDCRKADWDAHHWVDCPKSGKWAMGIAYVLACVAAPISLGSSPNDASPSADGGGGGHNSRHPNASTTWLGSYGAVNSFIARAPSSTEQTELPAATMAANGGHSTTAAYSGLPSTMATAGSSTVGLASYPSLSVISHRQATGLAGVQAPNVTPPVPVIPALLRPYVLLAVRLLAFVAARTQPVLLRLVARCLLLRHATTTPSSARGSTPVMAPLKSNSPAHAATADAAMMTHSTSTTSTAASNVASTSPFARVVDESRPLLEACFRGLHGAMEAEEQAAFDSALFIDLVRHIASVSIVMELCPYANVLETIDALRSAATLSMPGEAPLSVPPPKSTGGNPLSPSRPMSPGETGLSSSDATEPMITIVGPLGSRPELPTTEYGVGQQGFDLSTNTLMGAGQSGGTTRTAWPSMIGAASAAATVHPSALFATVIEYRRALDALKTKTVALSDHRRVLVKCVPLVIACAPHTIAAAAASPLRSSSPASSRGLPTNMLLGSGRGSGGALSRTSPPDGARKAPSPTATDHAPTTTLPAPPAKASSGGPLATTHLGGLRRDSACGLSPAGSIVSGAGGGMPNAAIPFAGHAIPGAGPPFRCNYAAQFGVAHGGGGSSGGNLLDSNQQRGGGGFVSSSPASRLLFATIQTPHLQLASSALPPPPSGATQARGGSDATAAADPPSGADAVAAGSGASSSPIPVPNCLVIRRTVSLALGIRVMALRHILAGEGLVLANDDDGRVIDTRRCGL